MNKLSFKFFIAFLSISFINTNILKAQNNGLYEPKMILVQGGSFKMGSDIYEKDAVKDHPLHQVTIHDFYMSETEVTQAQWNAIFSKNPSKHTGCLDCPVENVSWDSAQLYIEELSKKTGLHYRLPTEAEWEYAAKGGNNVKQQNQFSGCRDNKELKDYAWFNDNSYGVSHSVATKKPNELGFYDMTGNVWEWCSDWYAPDFYTTGPLQNPENKKQTGTHVLRGGSWASYTNYCHVTDRSPFFSADAYNGSVGLRVCLAN